ncbi:acyltransferase family protein [Rufibacter roseus]|uniref:Acyltransferase family protein n=1 Tax=Rufibacter roseus TaxID=1567108 RepID=A0ABW2DKC9_9BACT|nr:acyltransferase [Rufibacter roseus]
MIGLSTTNRIQYFPALTGFRALAAYMVFLHHAMPETPYIGGFFRLFFVLSGFLIAHKYINNYIGEGKTDWLPFFLQRLFRLYPLYLLCTIVALVFRQDFRLESWGINFLIAQGLFPQYTFSGIGVGWSLTSIVVFYAVAPFALANWTRLGLLRIWAITFLFGFAILAVGQLPWPIQLVPTLDFLLYITFFGRCFEFYVGIWIAQQLQPWHRASPHLLTKRIIFCTYIGIAGFLACMFLLPFLWALEERFSWIFFFAYGVNHFLIPIFIGGLILGLAKEKTLLSKILSTKISQELGKSSYFFYLVHYTFGFDLLYFHVWQNKLGVLLLLALFSVAGYRFLELPLHKWVIRLTARVVKQSPNPQL